MADFEMYSMVALVEDLRRRALYVVRAALLFDNWASGVYGVEFSDASGRTRALHSRPNN
jgi:hypothetical protein